MINIMQSQANPMTFVCVYRISADHDSALFHYIVTIAIRLGISDFYLYRSVFYKCTLMIRAKLNVTHNQCVGCILIDFCSVFTLLRLCKARNDINKKEKCFQQIENTTKGERREKKITMKYSKREIKKRVHCALRAHGPVQSHNNNNKRIVRIRKNYF